MQNISFKDCFKILNLETASNLQEVRRAYKQQIQLFHPDRIQSNSSQELSAAEEKIKQLNAAYKILSEYHQQYGRLPNIAPESKASSAAKTSNTVYQRPTKRQPDFVKTKLLLMGLTTGLITFTIFFVLNEIEPESSTNKTHLLDSVQVEPYSFSNESKKLEIEKPHTIKPVNKTPKKKFFTIGSGLGEVILSQGEPTRINGNTWYYGKSKIYFEKGEVKEWERHPENPLNAKFPNRINQFSNTFNSDKKNNNNKK